MKYARKSKKSMPRRKPVFKKKARYVRRIRSNANTDDATVTKINPGRSRIQRWLKTTPLNTPGVPSFPGTNGFSITTTTTAYNTGGTMTFDPSGTYGNVSGAITSISPSFSTLSSQALPEWTSFSNLYAQYKVNKITLKFTSQLATGSNQVVPVTLFMRYNDEYTPGAPNAVSISEERNWIKKVFTPEHPTFTYSFYPKVWQILDNLGAISTDARATKSMPFCNMNSPVELAGMKFYIQAQSTSSANAIVQCDIQYDISFKEQT